jgi:recombination DNA repair RAD52 pathway protein
MGFTNEQLRLLKAKLKKRHVRSRESGSKTLSYIEGWHAISEANRIFGYDGWDRTTLTSSCIWQGQTNGQPACSYTARVRICVRAGEALVTREGSGVGRGVGANLAEAHEMALKAAETDATKRALATFGAPFGLALHLSDKPAEAQTRTESQQHAVAAGKIVDPPASATEPTSTEPTPPARQPNGNGVDATRTEANSAHRNSANRNGGGDGRRTTFSSSSGDQDRVR